MPTSQPPSAQQLLDTFLLGMTWLREDRPDILARPGSSIFSAVRLAGVINEGQRRTLASNARLITLAMQNGEIIKGSRRPPKRQLEMRIATSRKYLLTLVTDQSVQYNKLFGGRGYQHVITEAGMVYARRVAPTYAELLNQEKFTRAWQIFRTQMRASNARSSKGSGRQAGDRRPVTEERTVHITREAKYGEDDFEW
jgi:hypothetical protein